MGGSELDVCGGTAQHVVIRLPGVGDLQGSGERNRERIGTLWKVLSTLLPAGLSHLVMAGGAHPADIQGTDPTGWVEAVPWGGLAMGVGWVCWQQEMQKSGQPGSDGKPHSATAAGLQIKITQSLRSRGDVVGRDV